MGKSWFERFVWYEWIARQKTRVILLAPTFKQAVDVHGKALEAELAGDWAFLGGKLNRTTWRVDFPNGSSIQFFGAENAHAARGVRCDLVTIDEADDIDPNVYDSVVRPWFSEPWSLGIRVLAGTPRRGRYGLLYRTYRRGIEGTNEKLDDHTSIHATAFDSPETVSRREVEKARLETPPAVFNREWLCDFDSSEGLVYGEVFDESFHIRPPPPDTVFREIVIGGDWGFEDPFSLVVIGLVGSGKDTTAYVVDEVYKQHLTPGAQLAAIEAIRDRFKQYKQSWYFDPSRPDAIEGVRQAGIAARGARNAIEDGIAFVADRFFRRTMPDGREFARLYVSPKCRATLHELGLYRRKRVAREDRIRDEPEDKNNHAMDALRYGLYTHIGVVERSNK